MLKTDNPDKSKNIKFFERKNQAYKILKTKTT